MSEFVICLVVVGAAIALVTRAVDRLQPATEEPATDREAAEPSRPRHLAPKPRPVETTGVVDEVAVELSVAQRVRSGVLLALLVTGVGASAAIGVGALVVVVVTAVRTAIG